MAIEHRRKTNPSNERSVRSLDASATFTQRRTNYLLDRRTFSRNFPRFSLATSSIEKVLGSLIYERFWHFLSSRFGGASVGLPQS